MKLKLATTFAMIALAVPALVPASALPPQEGTSQSRPRGQDPDKVLKMYDTRLNLTEDQRHQLRPIIEDRQKRMLDLRGDTSVKGREKMEKMRGVMEDSDRRINEVLNPDQRKKFAEMEAQRKEKMKERMRENTGK